MCFFASLNIRLSRLKLVNPHSHSLIFCLAAYCSAISVLTTSEPGPFQSWPLDNSAKMTFLYGVPNPDLALALLQASPSWYPLL
ncbi:hypothetical protein VNO77_41750 [Canavalia gladiata]|uniref:Uncharacterized protein n=1 Tax=Canavalia gladiata TaxID=3824 RepID=A0AAN9K0D6_CANGL